MDQKKEIKKTNDQIINSFSTELQTKVKTSISIIEEAVARYGYEGLSLSYNGGKDCLIILDLIHSIATGILPTNLTNPEKLKEIVLFYLRDEDDFEEIDEFVNTSLRSYDFRNYTKFATNSLKQGLIYILKEYPKLQGIFLGTRTADLKGRKQPIFAPTNGDWPESIRISPIMEWNYSDIWDYLLTKKVSYCELYDQGYTSLGLKSQTKQNPLLKQKNGEFLPAWVLSQKSSERDGRILSLSNSSTSTQIH
ncbi:fad synthase [Anaeramoeba flamelloides]|uniref:FAD synthase n=1 Tax=Anaeramoeba flamelloides TaxID=1746091 RepID=A0AAV7Z547_9EUKA|nr:fad synthase [Anaeramoeba flamelloides]KAJ6251524.1 fad synthase [Anaeramoeba flamelloides]